MEVLNRKPNTRGNDVIMVDVSGSGGGAGYSPSHIRVAEIEKGSEFTQINGKNVLSKLGDFEYNHFAGRGPDSRYAEAVKSAEKVFDEHTKQVDIEKKPQYPRMEAHLKTPEGTWHSASLYVDKEGKARGAVAVENREADIAEKHSVEYAERVSEKTGEKYLSAKVDREDGKTLYVNLSPVEKNGERTLKASFAERNPDLERGKQLVQIKGKGGELKANEALVERADKDRTAQYVRETLKVEPVQQEKSRQQSAGKELTR